MSHHTAASLLVVGVDGIQDWIVGASSELRVIRGGSLQLDAAFEDVIVELGRMLGPPSPVTDTPPLQGWQILVRSSGAVTLALGPEHDPGAVRDRIRRVLAEQTPDLLAHVGTSRWDDSFEQARTDAYTNAETLHLTQLSAHVPGSLVCTSCGSASGGRDGFRPGPDADAWNLCGTCRRRSELSAASRDRDVTEGWYLEPEMQRIGEATRAARWRGYVGVICADGNAVGQLFAGITRPTELAERSQQVKAAVSSNVTRALERAVEDHDGDTDLPVNLLVQAGDDLRLIVPAHVAATTAAELCRGPELTGCAGVVITRATMPFRDAHDHAESLLDGVAKRRARSLDPLSPPAMVAFTAETGSRPRSAGAAPDRITAGPYAPDVVDALLVAADGLRVPEHALRLICERLREGGRVATREWQLFLGRRSPDDRQTLASLWSALGASLERPWVTDHEESPMGDLLLLRSLRRQEVGA